MGVLISGALTVKQVAGVKKGAGVWVETTWASLQTTCPFVAEVATEERKVICRELLGTWWLTVPRLIVRVLPETVQGSLSAASVQGVPPTCREPGL